MQVEQKTCPQTVEHKVREDFCMVPTESKQTRHEMVGCSSAGGLGGASGGVIRATL